MDTAWSLAVFGSPFAANQPRVRASFCHSLPPEGKQDRRDYDLQIKEIHVISYSKSRCQLQYTVFRNTRPKRLR